MPPPRTGPKALPQPKKRPTQARAKFTVDALYGAFVRIWRRDGSDAATMRAVAKEAGYAVGTLYEYFASREALLSGYFRHCLDNLCRRVVESDDDDALAWRARMRRLVGATFDEAGIAPYFDGEMLLLEARIADQSVHQRAFTKLCKSYQQVLSRWPDAPAVSPQRVERLVLHLWGARRYAILLNRDAVDEAALCAATAAAISILES